MPCHRKCPLSAPPHQLFTVICLQGLKLNNLHIIGLKSKLFLMEVKQELVQITEDKNILTLVNIQLIFYI